MKSDDISRQFPADPDAWERVIAQAPGEDRPPTAAEEAAWSDAVVVKAGGYLAIHAALKEKRYRKPNKRNRSAPTSECRVGRKESRRPGTAKIAGG